MTLTVYTAPFRYDGPDRLDITRASGVEGLAFAPSWAILRPALEARRDSGPQAKLFASAGETLARMTSPDSWLRYVQAYTSEMRDSYRHQRPAWDALLARSRVVLVCYCGDAQHCHRSVLARILVTLGASCVGEVAPNWRPPEP